MLETIKKPYVQAFLIFVFLTLLYLNSYIVNFNKPINFDHEDTYLVNLTLKHYMHVFTSGSFGDLAQAPMFYGFKNSLSFTDSYFMQALQAFPIYLLISKNIIVVTNMVNILTILASLMAMYILIFYFTKSQILSILGSIIYVFNPYVSAHFPEHQMLFSVQWIPLIFLFFEKSLELQSRRNLFLFFLFLTCQLLSSLYYAVFLTVILPLYISLRILQKKVKLKKFINLGSVLGLLFFFSVVLISAHFYLQTFSNESIHRGLEETNIYSAKPIDLFLNLNTRNVLYSKLAQELGLETELVLVSSETTYFWGITVWVLFIIISILVIRNFRKYQYLFLLLLLIIFCVLFSFGPQIAFGDNFKIPGPYLFFYKIDPLVRFLRAPPRIAAFIFFFLALFICLSLPHLTRILGSFKKKVLYLIITLFILIEYWNKPLGFINITNEQKHFYEVLNNQSQIKVILNLPIGYQIYTYPEGTLGDNVDYHYLLWASALHSKNLFNGSSGFIPDEYTRRVIYLRDQFPTMSKIEKLKSWGVDGIVLNREEYSRPQEFDLTSDLLNELGVKKVIQTPNLVLFDLTRK